jgi:hypothetical protein
MPCIPQGPTACTETFEAERANGVAMNLLTLAPDVATIFSQLFASYALLPVRARLAVRALQEHYAHLSAHAAVVNQSGVKTVCAARRVAARGAGPLFLPA